MKLFAPTLVCCIAILSVSCSDKPQTPAREHWLVTVGAQSREQLFAQLRKTALSEQNEDESFILLVRDSPDFKISRQKEELDLVVVTAAELKLPLEKWEAVIPFDEFKAKVAEAGYRLCPHDAAALVTLSIKGHERLDFTYVAMEPIMGMREKRPQQRPLVPIVFTHLGRPYVVMRPLDLFPEAPRRYIVARPRTPSA